MLSYVALVHVVLLGATPALATAFDVTVQPLSKESLFFAGRTSQKRYLVTATPGWEGRACWSVSIDHRTIHRGETGIQARKESTPLAIPLRIPPITEPIIVTGQIAVVLVDGTGRRAGEHVQSVHFASDEPFAGRRGWVKQLNIALFDPVGCTVKRFDQMELPYRRLLTVNDIATLDHGIVIVGEGASFAPRVGLTRQLFDAVGRGVGVLCLAPSDGEWPIPDPLDGDSNVLRPTRISLRGDDVLNDLDKRVVGSIAVATRFAVRADRDRTCWRVEDSRVGWTWVDVDYEPRSGRLVLCGFGLVDSWDMNPGPRFLLLRILETFVSTKR